MAQTPAQFAWLTELQVDQIDQVLDVEEVADLLARAAVADVGERPAEEVAEQPPGEDTLIDLAHLPGAGDHAAAVDHRSQPEGIGVLLDQVLGGELGGAVERAGAGHRERLGDACRPGAGDRLGLGELEAGLSLLESQLQLRGDRVDAAGGEEDEEGILGPGALEAVEGAEQVGLDRVGGIGEAGQDRGLGRALDHRLEAAAGGQVGGLAHVPVAELDPGSRAVAAGSAPSRAA